MDWRQTIFKLLCFTIFYCLHVTRDLTVGTISCLYVAALLALALLVKNQVKNIYEYEKHVYLKQDKYILIPTRKKKNKNKTQVLCWCSNFWLTKGIRQIHQVTCKQCNLVKDKNFNEIKIEKINEQVNSRPGHWKNISDIILTKPTANSNEKNITLGSRN